MQLARALRVGPDANSINSGLVTKNQDYFTTTYKVVYLVLVLEIVACARGVRAALALGPPPRALRPSPRAARACPRLEATRDGTATRPRSDTGPANASLAPTSAAKLHAAPCAMLCAASPALHACNLDHCCGRAARTRPLHSRAQEPTSPEAEAAHAFLLHGAACATFHASLALVGKFAREQVAPRLPPLV